MEKIKKYIPFIIITILLMIISILITLLVVDKHRFSTNTNNSNYGKVNEVKDGIVKVKMDDESELDIPSNEEVNTGDYVYVNEDKKIEVVAKKDDIVTTTTNKTTTTTTTTKKVVEATNYTEDDVVDYVESTYNNLEKNKNDKSSTFKTSVKNGFITVVDFIFYDGTIKGYKFKDLSASAKAKVIKIGLKIDNFIDTIFPGYKETISTKYNNIKNKLISEYIDDVNNVCNMNPENCNTIKKDFSNMMKNLSVPWTKLVTILKEKGVSALDNLKRWYEIYSGK